MLKTVNIDMQAEEFFICSDVKVIDNVRKFLTSDTWNEITIANKIMLDGFQAVMKYDFSFVDYDVVFKYDGKEYLFSTYVGVFVDKPTQYKVGLELKDTDDLNEIFSQVVVHDYEDWKDSYDELLKIKKVEEDL